MATPTYDPIASTTLTSSASSVTFSSLDTIAAGYRDLVVAIDAKTATANRFSLRFNSDTAGNYSYSYMRGDGSGTNSYADTGLSQIGYEYFAYDYMVLISIMDFAATDKHKTALMRLDHPQQNLFAYAGRWANTSAITSVDLSANAGTWASGSTFSLFGIAA